VESLVGDGCTCEFYQTITEKTDHFAVMPPELVRPCVLAGTSARGCCPACGAPWVRVVELTGKKTCSPDRWGRPRVIDLKGNSETTQQRGGAPAGCFTNEKVTTGWEPSCSCPPADPVGCVVLDPFAGSGTTLAVAVEENRRAVGCELNPEYVRLIHRRMRRVTPSLVEG
jgi:hypothetical protein